MAIYYRIGGSADFACCERLDGDGLKIYSENMIFSWDDDNREHLAKHSVAPEEAEEVVRGARRPFPRAIGDEKLMVWGRTAAGRYLQVIFVLKTPDELSYESLTPEQWQSVMEDQTPRIVRIIHAMDLTDDMKRRLRKRWR